MTPAALIVLAFLDLFPLPVCTPELPHGALQEPTCPKIAGLRDTYAFQQTEMGWSRCVKRLEA